MVRDGRKLEHKTLKAIRRMAVERVQQGEAPRVVITSHGFCRTTIYKWLQKVKHGGRGDPLRSGPDAAGLNSDQSDKIRSVAPSVLKRGPGWNHGQAPPAPPYRSSPTGIRPDRQRPTLD
jgi:hypothetical protein